MPVKQCPKCSIANAVARKTCSACGEVFTKIKKEKLSKKKEKTKSNVIDTDITIGGWAKNIDKGMPKIEEPEPLPTNKRLNLTEIREIVSYEGLGYSILEYVDPKKIMDDVLRDMWTIAKKQLIEIKMYVYKE